MDELQDGCWESKVLPTASEDQVCDHPRNLNTHKSLGPGEMHGRVLSQLADRVVKSLSVVFEKSWQSAEVLGGSKKSNIVPV